MSLADDFDQIGKPKRKPFVKRVKDAIKEQVTPKPGDNKKMTGDTMFTKGDEISITIRRKD